MRISSFVSTFVLAVALVPLAGCPAPAEVDPEIDPGFEPAGEYSGGEPAERSPELDAARQRWEDAGLDAYQFTLQRICFCPMPDYTGPFEVTVRHGTLDTVLLEGAVVADERGMTVDDLFALIEDAYEREAESVDVTFDPDLGYPTSISIDYSSLMADEEMGYRVSGLKADDR